MRNQCGNNKKMSQLKTRKIKMLLNLSNWLLLTQLYVSYSNYLIYLYLWSTCILLLFIIRITKIFSQFLFSADSTLIFWILVSTLLLMIFVNFCTLFRYLFCFSFTRNSTKVFKKAINCFLQKSKKIFFY